MDETSNEDTAQRPDAPAPPSRRPLRIALGVIAAVAVVYLLFTVVFPWFQEYQDDPTLEGTGAAPGAVAGLVVHVTR